MTNFDSKKKIVENGSSEIFNNWNEKFGISKDEFIENLKWVCEDPANGRSTVTTKNDGLTREIAIDANHDARVRAENMSMSDEARKMFGQPYDESKCEAHIVKLRRVVNDFGHTEYYRIDNGKLFESVHFIAIGARDRV
ncbi:hypothetical protein [Limosilactobacillus antri]|uniref:hypothetical protein n=1 Tax=Limosilactobacillus antri TaxID=227943 RepID=UPI001F58F8A8|nr:hypothetical protein [Limosilactobacillus antri]